MRTVPIRKPANRDPAERNPAERNPVTFSPGRFLPLLALGLIAMLAAGCGDSGEDSNADGPIRVATSTVLNADIIRSAYGDKVEVVSVVPDSASPHTWSPTPKAVAALNDADVIVVNGVEPEEGLAAALDSAEENGQTICEFRPPAGDDAHFQTSPTETAKALTVLTPCLTKVADELGLPDSGELADSASVHAGTLAELATEVSETLAPIPAEDRLLVTSHNSFSSFAKENDLEVLGTMLGTGGDSHGHGGPNPAVIAHLADEMNSEGLGVVFVSPGDPDDVADLLLSEVDHEVEVRKLLAESFDTESTGVEDHISLIRFNAAQILEGLEGP